MVYHCLLNEDWVSYQLSLVSPEATKRDLWEEKEVVNSMQYTLGMITVGTVFSSNIDLSKNKNIEDEKIKHIQVKSLSL